jgi:uncharacterized protein (TIGR02996 family)
MMPPRPQLLAFLQDAKENADDDAPRLVLADWLDETGDPRDAARAELLRLQCRLERLDPAEADALRPRERQLIAAHGREWLGPLADRAGPVVWKRGLGRIELPAAAFLDRTAAAGPGWDRLARCEEYAWLDGLALSELPAADLPALLASARLGGFTCLRLVACTLGPLGAAQIAHCGRLAHLRELDLGDNQIGPGGARELAASACLGGLRSLNLWANALDVEGAAALAGSPLLAGLRRLNVAYNALGAEGVAVLAPHLGRLDHLEVWSNDIGCRGLGALLESPLGPRLREFDLPWNDLRNEGAALLADSPRVAAARRLFLFCNRIQDEGAEALAASPHLAGLEVLDLDANRIGDRGARALARAPHLGRLRVLSLAKNDVGPAARLALERRFGPRVHLKDG